jgi:hypothetical protein
MFGSRDLQGHLEMQAELWSPKRHPHVYSNPTLTLCCVADESDWLGPLDLLGWTGIIFSRELGTYLDEPFLRAYDPERQADCVTGKTYHLTLTLLSSLRWTAPSHRGHDE